MNRLELEKQIIVEGEKRGITVTKCTIHSRKDHIDFYPTIRNNYASRWVYKHQVEELISDLSPLERPCIINKIKLDESRYDLFKVGDEIEMEDIWIRLDAGELEPDIIKIGSATGQYRSGWVKGTVFEVDGRGLGIKFSRTVYLADNAGWIESANNLEKLIRDGTVKTIDAGQPIWSGTHTWRIRK
jgi:hypothetical protein